MPFAELGNKRIWYEISGSGQPLVQLPGVALELRNFSRVTPVLARHFRVVDFDVVGTGKSTLTPPGYTLQDWTNDVRDLMDLLEIPQAHLHGHIHRRPYLPAVCVSAPGEGGEDSPGGGLGPIRYGSAP